MRLCRCRQRLQHRIGMELYTNRGREVGVKKARRLGNGPAATKAGAGAAPDAVKSSSTKSGSP